MKSLKMYPMNGHPSEYKTFTDFVATLDLLSVPLFEGSMLGIVLSMEPSHLIIKTELLEKYLGLLEEPDMINVFKFFSTISIARTDAGEFLTDGLIDKICQQMVYSESHNQQDVTGAAMTLLSNIGSLSF